MLRSACIAGAVLLGPLARLAPAQEGDDASQKFFALPTARDTRELAAAAEEHLRAERYPEALSALQRILEDHAQEVLPADRARQGARSTYPGAAEWALERMLALPSRAREEYCARYEPRAAEALERARLAPQRSSLVAIARQWPIVPSAVRAWWALGDLELEGGQQAAAELAWRRALALADAIGLELVPPPAESRLAWLRARAAEPSTVVRPGPSLPRGDAVPWTRELDMTPFAQRGGPQIGRNLQPVCAGGKVLVGTTLRLYALDAYDGEVLWQAGPPRGWSLLATPDAETKLFEGINYKLVLAPAVGDGVALAVLQEPFTENENEEWQGITIMTAIPERRLHAFDLASGRELWNHAPKLTFDGLRQRWDEGGTYAQRMMVAGSPTVAGARVLVPCYRMQGRIDYHVACYQLETGELLWSTLVISGQRERNMFGRSVYEFCASPLVVVGDRVLAQTELGTIAALDLFSGRILWQTTYKQIELPKTRSYTPPKRDLTWELAPPAVVGDVLVATPSDSRDIIGLKVSDGSHLWTYGESKLRELHRETELLGFNVLLGADEDTLYLSGAKLSALQKPGGIGSTAPFVQRWTRRLERPDTSPRALLTSDAILAPNTNERVVFDRKSGESIPTLGGSWLRGDPGYLWAGEGSLFSLSSNGIAGYFDWQSQLERARRWASSGADEDVSAAAELFLRRGKLFLEEGALENARATLQESRSLFARLRERSPRRDARGELACARALAEVLARLSHEDEALLVLASARELSGSHAELLACLFQEERILRSRGGAARIRVLDEIETRASEEALPEDMRAEAALGWLAGASGGEALEPEPGPLPVAFWAELERAGEREHTGELAAALADLHAALARAGALQLGRGFPATKLVRERIARVLELPGGREAYAPMEARAAAELEAARASADEAALARVADDFPHSKAAEQALALQLEHAVAAHDARTVTRLVGEALASSALTSERETGLLLVLARALGEQGNTAFERALVSSLARAEPARVSPLPEHSGATLGALAAELAKDAVEPASAPVRFEPGVASSGKQRAGLAEFLGVLRPQGQAQESPPLELHLYAVRGEIQAYSSAAPGQPAWKRALDQPFQDGGSCCAFAPGRFVFGTRDGLTCLDENGTERWTRATDDDPPRALALADGVLVARLRSGAVLACDSHLGLFLWEKTLGTSGSWSGPLAGDGHTVFFSQVHGQAPRALALDLFRGRTTADVRLSGLDPRSVLEDAAWISGERLIVPSFQLRPAQLSAFALEGGRRAWTYSFGADEDLQGLVQSEGRTFPVTYAAALGNAAGNGGVYELDESTGSVRRVVPLKPGERVLGLEARTRVQVPSPYLFTLAQSEAERSVPIRAIQLPNGYMWTWALPVAGQEVYDGRDLPMPAVSADCVAIAYPMRRASNQGTETTIVFVDKRAGKRVDTVSLTLNGAFTQAGQLELRGLGEALFVLGKGATPRGGCLEILEQLR